MKKRTGNGIWCTCTRINDGVLELSVAYTERRNLGASLDLHVTTLTLSLRLTLSLTVSLTPLILTMLSLTLYPTCKSRLALKFYFSGK